MKLEDAFFLKATNVAFAEMMAKVIVRMKGDIDAATRKEKAAAEAVVEQQDSDALKT